MKRKYFKSLKNCPEHFQEFQYSLARQATTGRGRAEHPNSTRTMPLSSPLRIRRIVTGHNDQAIAIVRRDDLLLGDIQPHGNIATTLWTSDSSPADAQSEDDKAKVDVGMVNNGAVVRTVDFPPHSTGKLHRTISLDYIVVLKGTVALTLDDGSKTPVAEGEFVVQQATMHGWDNDSDDWARILCVLTAAKAPVVGGVELKTHVQFTLK